MAIDTETSKQLTDADHVRSLLNSQGWAVIKRALDDYILDLQNINNLDFTSEQTVLFDLKARKMAADLLFAWLRDNVYGFVEQQDATTRALDDAPTETFIERE